MRRPTKTAERRRWRLDHVLAVVAVGLLAALVTPGCTWLFGFNRANPQVTIEPGGGYGGGHLLYPALPPVVSDGPSLFIAPASGYRSLGGIFIYQDRLIIIRAPASEKENDIALGLAFGNLVAEHHIDRLTGLAQEDCLGNGDEPEAVIQAQKVGKPEDEVGAGIACARLRHPGAVWIASKLMVNDKHAVAFTLLEQQGDDTRFGVYTDVTRFAWQGGVLQ